MAKATAMAQKGSKKPIVPSKKGKASRGMNMGRKGTMGRNG